MRDCEEIRVREKNKDILSRTLVSSGQNPFIPGLYRSAVIFTF